MRHRTRAQLRRFAVLACVLGVSATAMTGCRGDRTDKPPRQFFPGLKNQAKYTPQSESTFFEDGRSMREPVAGTVAFGRSPHADDPMRERLLREDPLVYRGRRPDGSVADRVPVRRVLGVADNEPIPTERMREFIERGRNRYDIFCIVCHGGTGAGDGAVGVLWTTPIPSFHDARFLPGGDSGADGHIFDIIRNGLPNVPGQLPAMRMPAYGDRINEHDAWAIVAYIRALQRSRIADFDDIPEVERERLDEMRPAPTPDDDGAGNDNATTEAAVTSTSQEDRS